MSDSTNLAVIADRLETLGKDFAEFRKETNAKLVAVQGTLDMARGGYFVLAAIGAIALVVATCFEKVMNVFH